MDPTVPSRQPTIQPLRLTLPHQLLPLPPPIHQLLPVPAFHTRGAPGTERSTEDARDAIRHATPHVAGHATQHLGSRDQATLAVFFSPVCGSCQQELHSLGVVHEDIVQTSRLLLILNKPEQEDEALLLLEQAELPRNALCALMEGSAYDHITQEPTTWIVDRSGTVASRHTGYRDGDVDKYHRELLAAGDAG